MKRFTFGLVAAAMGMASSVGAAGPIVKGPWMQHVTPTSAVVRVEVDPPAPVTLEVGMQAVVGSADSGAGSVIESTEVRALHTILVQGLEPATRYSFTVRARGAPRYGAITTAPREDSGEPFHFLIYGDNRTDEAAHGAVVRAMVAAPSSFLINTGDLVEKGGSAPEWQTFFDIEAPLMRERPLFSCVGNHELVDGAGIQYVHYLGPADLPVTAVPIRAVTGVPLRDAGASQLTLDQLNGTFRWSNARFFMINGMVPYTSGPTREWLDKVLTDSDHEPGLVWRIVVVHHGPWSSGPHGNNALLHDGKIPELLRAHKVDVVLSGHDHIYERGFADGLAYVVSGGGGAPVYRVKKAQATSLHYESVRHFIDALVSPSAIRFVATRPDGSTVESCSLVKGSGWDCDPPSVKAANEAAVASSSPTPSRCGCRVVGAEGGHAKAPHHVVWLTALALVSSLFARRRARNRARVG